MKDALARIRKFGGHSYGEQHQVEDAVMASEIEALPDQAGFVKFASSAAWNWGKFAYYDVVPRATGECSGGAS